MHWSSVSGGASGFTLEERDRRWKRVRDLMAEHRLDYVMAFPQWMGADALYLANQMGVVIFPADGEPSLVIGGEDSHLAVKREGWIADRRSATSTGSTRSPYGDAAARVVTDMKIGDKRVGLVGLEGHNYASVRQPEGYLNHTTTMKVLEAMPDAEVVDATGVLAMARYVKSEEEIALLRQAVEIGEASARAMHEHAKPGVAQAEVFGQMLLAQVRERPTDIGVAWCPGEWGQRRPRLTSPPPGTMEPGLFVATEIMPTVRGYAGQIAEPLVMGPVPAQALEIFEVGRAAFHGACKAMRPGRTWGEVEEETLALAKGSGYKIDFLMHGRGLGNDGPLLIPTDTHDRTKNDVLEANTAFVLKPNAYPEDAEPVARSWDVNWGDCVVVRDEGAERLGTRPYELHNVE